jgi:hypothetical protein
MRRSSKKPRAAIPQALRFNVFRRDNFTCRYCGKQSPEVILHLDHIKPVADSGRDTEENFATSCVDCNQGKSSKTGITPPLIQKDKNPGFIGMFGHTFDEKGKVNWQFVIDKQLDDHHFAITTFSWLSGYDYSTEILTKADLLSKKCRLYPTAEQMNDFYERKRAIIGWDT